MSIEAVVRSVLLGFAPVTALVGQRVYTKMLPPTVTLPAIRVQRVSEVEELHLRGPGNLRRARVQVDAVGGSGADVEAVAAAVHGDGVTTGLRAFRGTESGIRIVLAAPAGLRDDYIGEEMRQFRVMRDYMVTWDIAE